MMQCGFWQIADILNLEERQKFAEEIIDSLNSNNFATMELLGFNQVQGIPTIWVEIILDRWSEKLLTEKISRISFSNYIEHYLALVYKYRKKFGSIHPKLKEIFTILTSKKIRLSENFKPIEDISSSILELDESLQELWKLILLDLKPLFIEENLEEILHNWLDI